MGIRVSGLQLLAEMLPARRILSLGYPDILATKEDIIRIFGVEPASFVNTGKWHRVNYPLPETTALFQQLGCELVCVDVHASRGVERIVDLNAPAELGKYDIVMDMGTIEHCFNIGQALKNAVNAVDIGGRIFHTSQFAATLGRPVHDLSALNEDLESMLVLLSLIDDYVGVSNTNMHLRAGAGKTARVLVPAPPEWRWMAEGKESPWFPGFSVYRQRYDGSWEGALAELQQDMCRAFGN